MKEQKQRDYCIDALKMMLIVLVIYGHIPLLDGFIHNGVSIECNTLTWTAVNGIYAFHMPLFVLISGYFTRQKQFAEQLSKSINLLRLFLIFHLIDLFLNWCYSETTPSLHSLVYPSFAIWYLLCLFYWRILISLIPNKWNRKHIVVASVAISLMIGFVPIRGEIGFHRFFSFMPYFMIGHYYGQDMMQRVQIIANRFTPPILALLIIFMLLIAIVASFNPRWLDVIISPYSNYKGLLLRTAYLGYSMLLCFGILIVFKFKKNWNQNSLSTLGEDTLFFYLYHPYILYSVVYAWSLLTPKVNFLSSLLIVGTTTMLLLLLHRNKYLHNILR